MRRRSNLAYFLLAIIVALGLAPLMVCVDVQAQIAFVSERDGNYEIYVMDAEGKNQRRLTNNRRDNRYPSWSPDGKRIAFTSSGKVVNVNVVGVHPPIVVGEPPQIYVMDADGKNQQRLTNNDFAEWEPSCPFWCKASTKQSILFNYSNVSCSNPPSSKAFSATTST